MIVIGISQGRTGLKNILRSVIKWRTPVWTYLFAVLFILIVYIFTAGIVYLTDPAILKFRQLPGVAETVIYFFVIAIIGGPLGEEIGWRGFLQPELLKRFNPAVASLFIGLIWLLWHIPLFWLEGAAQSGGSIIYFALSVFAMAFLFTLIYLKSNGSLLLAILFHTMINYVSAFIIPGILPATETDKSFGHISTYTLSGLAVLFFLLFFRTFITKQKE
jgi:membrane protease YdiL (CAAX protease family)